MTDKLIEALEKIEEELRAEYQSRVEVLVAEKGRAYSDQIIGKTFFEIFPNPNVPIYQDKVMIWNIFRRDGNFLESPFIELDEKEVKRFSEKEAKLSGGKLFNGLALRTNQRLKEVIKRLKVEDITVTINKKNMDGNLLIQCNKGTSFSMSFKVDMKMSKKRVWVGTFRIRFKDIVKSDGTKLETATEKKMKEEFK